MDIDKINQIKIYQNEIIKFKKLDKFKNLSKNNFKNEMEKIFPKFSKENPSVFNIIIENKNLEYLELMYNKIFLINKEFEDRKDEIKYINDPIIFIINNKDNISKSTMITEIDKKYHNFSNNYNIIIDKLYDKEYKYNNNYDLLLEQIKYKHEIDIGDKLAKHYIYPKLNKTKI